MSDSEKQVTVLDSADVKTLTRSEQRRKNRLENKARKKSDEPATKAKEGNFLTRAYNFFVDAKEELSRVVWPSRKETIDSTWRLLILVIIAGLYLGLVDGILSRLMALIA